ncbi:MAG: M28 family peptidase, partial [Bacteroidetes bacterium]|nr:M28 family peptidase [Bacteroidota bacterium]
DWYQEFEFTAGFKYGQGNALKIADAPLKIDKDFYPIPYSADGKIFGTIADVGSGLMDSLKKIKGIAPRLNGKILLVNLEEITSANPHSQTPDWHERYKALLTYKPAAVIFYNSDRALDITGFKQFNNLMRDSLLIMHATKETAEKLKKLPGIKVEMEVHIDKIIQHGRNVIGFIDNGKLLTVVIGAHYDHLGMGEQGHSLYVGNPEVHNGADDNGSGTVSLIELGRILKTSGAKNHNYLLIAFSGEEMGLLGSKHFTNNPTLPIAKMDYMLNMDMVGRLDSLTKELGVNGIGTSPTWDSIIKKVSAGAMKIKTTESGMGPSDQTSFYLKDVPALHFFSGTHPDYHKPSDDIEKINFGGMAGIVNYIHAIVMELDSHSKLSFTKTKQDSTTAPRYKVTLGIIPDYFYDKGGVRADGISAGKPAEKAGLKAGDIIMKIGDYDTGDMNAYMTALSKHKKGDEADVTIKRGTEAIILKVKF